MNLDELLDSWRSQDQGGLYAANVNRLQEAVRQEQAKWRRYMRMENWITYGMSATRLRSRCVHEKEPLEFNYGGITCSRNRVG